MEKGVCILQKKPADSSHYWSVCVCVLCVCVGVGVGVATLNHIIKVITLQLHGEGSGTLAG